MNFITWALNSDSAAALFKSSRQGTVWTLPRPARSTEVTETQAQMRRACGEEHGERRIPACGYATSAARPGLSTSAAIHLPGTASPSPHGRAGWDLCSHTQQLLCLSRIASSTSWHWELSSLKRRPTKFSPRLALEEAGIHPKRFRQFLDHQVKFTPTSHTPICWQRQERVPWWRSSNSQHRFPNYLHDLCCPRRPEGSLTAPFTYYND